jgi:hypothetical protein
MKTHRHVYLTDYLQNICFVKIHTFKVSNVILVTFLPGDRSNAGCYLKAYIDSAANCKPLNFLRCGGDELLVGRAGYLSGVLWLDKVFGRGTFPAKDINELCKCIVESGRKYSQHHRSPCPLMYSYYNVEYLGQLIFFLYINQYGMEKGFL